MGRLGLVPVRTGPNNDHFVTFAHFIALSSLLSILAILLDSVFLVFPAVQARFLSR